ncbi:golgin candidate 5 [Sesamum indicum]|uniref:Golgin candidate 5 n=1 Tax=Sesamum indicum TaxID=4182 RepID=A0A6I9T8Z1_SESIN|nr:golgin candidate 5 [Sesamum indicum]XP_011080732.1 golgin candidate 5 [Sesamum indicum]XP_011080740.1 golgin candidate 5 [Sesamum indicum]
MAWFSGKVSLGNFPDFAGAVNKLSESVKNIEKNFDSALGLEEKSDATGSDSEATSGLWPTDRKALFEPIIGFMGQKGEESTVESLETSNASKPTSPVRTKQIDDDDSTNQVSAQIPHGREANEEKDSDVKTGFGEEIKDTSEEPKDHAAADNSGATVVLPPIPVPLSEEKPEEVKQTESANNLQEEERAEEIFPTLLESVQPESAKNLQEEVRLKEMSPTLIESVQPEPTSPGGKVEVVTSESTANDAPRFPEGIDEQNAEDEDVKEVFTAQSLNALPGGPAESRESSAPNIPDKTTNAEDNSTDKLPILHYNEMEASTEASDLVMPPNDTAPVSIELKQHLDKDANVKEQRLSTGSNSSDIVDSVAELEKVKKEMKMMETALHGAARQAQAKADEIAKLMNENEQLKAVIDDLRTKTNEAEIEYLREEYHQRVAALERKVYALTKERDTLRREQSKKSDAAALLKEKDEIITQVMAEGEELSKKQAAQESQIRKLRAQIRELEEEKKGLLTKLQVEENKVDSIKKDKAATEKLLQETVEKHQAELATQKEYYTNALNAAKEAEALAEARADTEARIELESRLRETEDRESMLVQTLEELRQTLSRKEQQAVFREDMLRRDIEDLHKRYQASERRCEELITQVPESTRPLLRQIEAMQETASRRAEAWAAVERSLNSRLQEAETKAAAAEEKERSINERLTQTLSRINVLEAQISCLRAEQTQLTRSLEKERQRAAENRQEYLALKEEADTHESRAHQLEEEIRELRRKHKEELHEALMHQELLQKELERERAARLDQERAVSLQSSAVPDQSPRTRPSSAAFDNGNLTRKISSTSSLGNMEESYFLQTTLDSSENSSERRIVGEGAVSPYYMKSVTSSTFEAALRQKEGELASYASRLASMESIRDSLAEELVKMTAQCEKLRGEAATLPGIRAELEALRRRHSAALELMGERDEELEELRADIVDLKEMYREQVNLLVNKIQRLSSAIGTDLDDT